MGATAGIALGVQAVGGIMKAQGTRKTGQQQQAMYDYNAGIEDQKAGLVRRAAALNDRQAQQIQDSVIGAQRAAYAASGVKVDTGTPLDVMVQSLNNSHLDRAIGNYNSDIAARGLESSANIMRRSGANARSSGNANAFASLLETAGDVATTYFLGGK